MWWIYLGGTVMVIACIIVLFSIASLCYLRCKWLAYSRDDENEPLIDGRYVPSYNDLYRAEELTPEETPTESLTPEETPRESSTPEETPSESQTPEETPSRASPIPSETETITLEPDTSQPSSIEESGETIT